MIPRAIIALADEPPPVSITHGIGLVVALAIAAAAVAAGLWLAKRRGGGQ